ncbi:MAG: tyrosine-type recombinase/integrase [Thermoanaerobaculales bacterium]
MARTAGQIKPRGEDRWLVSVYLCRDAAGKKIYQAKTVHGGRKAAEKALRAMLREKDTGRLVVPSRQTFGEFLEQWLVKAVTPRTRTSTLESYRHVVNAYVLPELGRIRLDKLSPLHLQGLVAKLTERGLAPRTIRYAFALVNSALVAARRWRMLAWNPMEEVDLPHQQRHELRVPDSDARGRLLDELQRDSLWPLWCLMVTTGLRPGEALGLQWGDVDLDADTLSVRRALSRHANPERTAEGGWTFAEPKTAAGQRTLPIPPETADVLRHHRAHQREERMRYADHYTDRGLVFAGLLGQPLDWRNVREYRFRPAQRRAALTCTVCGELLELGPEGRPAHKRDGAGHAPAATLELLSFRPYDLRHLHASLLLARGIDLKTIAQRLGHANASFTLNTYTHVVPGTQAAASAAIGEEIFGQASGRKR